ncbi:MAG: hypothetical protein JWM76_2167, partial [Pseudonocardiales bacterium]|nr:hypothetical protein [Pseudonocardiales bacterium]
MGRMTSNASPLHSEPLPIETLPIETLRPDFTTLTPLSDEAMSAALHRAAARATLAPSIHNTQPWRFVVRAGQLDVYADRSTAVPIIDPAGRQLAISCGAAIFGARVSLAASNIEAVTMLLP